ncbi:MAG: YggT family protein [Thermaerobacter sp.]|nr:YggT family protein [Thermaerobacter sp.]
MLGATVYGLLATIGNLLTILLVLRAVLSFFPPPHRSSPLFEIGRMLYMVTEPVLRPIRSVLPDFGGMDLSPLVAILAIWVLLMLLRSLLAF